MLTALANHSRCCDLRKDIATYDAYGNLSQKTGTTQNDYRFAGEQFDSHVGQYYLRARYYDAGVGRFAGRDPFEGDMTNPLSLAKYPYVHGNPVNSTDPSGMMANEQLSTLTIAQNLSVAFFNTAKAIAPKFVTGAVVVGGSAATATSIVIGVNLSKIIVKRVLETANRIGAKEPTPGTPIVVFGGKDLPEHSLHVFFSFVGLGQTISRRSETRPRIPVRSGPNIPLTPLLHKRSGNWDRDWLQILIPSNGVEIQAYKKNNNVDIARDEYPFATAKEGGKANFYQNEVSVRVLSLAESNYQGQVIKAFYNAIGVSLKPGDAFGVIAVPFDDVESGWFPANSNSFVPYKQ